MPGNPITTFILATSSEIGSELGTRLKAARLSQGIQQGELARMAGVSRAAVTSLENGGGSSLDTFLKVVIALGLTQDLQELFATKPISIAQLEAAAQKSQRAPRKKKTTAGADVSVPPSGRSSTKR